MAPAPPLPPARSFTPNSERALKTALAPLRRGDHDEWYEGVLNSAWMEDEWMRASASARSIFAQACQQCANHTKSFETDHRPTISVMVDALIHERPFPLIASFAASAREIWNDSLPLTDPQRRRRPLQNPVLAFHSPTAPSSPHPYPLLHNAATAPSPQQAPPIFHHHTLHSPYDEQQRERYPQEEHYPHDPRDWSHNPNGEGSSRGWPGNGDTWRRG
ncbi:hypothetical protein JCM10450v2_005101 [Rhodotorula kratochvilovae]